MPRGYGSRVAADFVRWEPAEAGALADLLAGEDWPFHAGGRPGREAVLERAATGYYDGPDARTFWVVDGGEGVGVLRLYDLEDEGAQFDLRIRAGARGRGLGTAAVRWLTGHLFAELAHVTRVEATTRADNAGMRAVLRRCGYRLEARYRRAWPVPGGPPQDSLGYAVLRDEWPAGGPPLPVVGAVLRDRSGRAVGVGIRI